MARKNSGMDNGNVFVFHHIMCHCHSTMDCTCVSRMEFTALSRLSFQFVRMSLCTSTSLSIVVIKNRAFKSSSGPWPQACIGIGQYQVKHNWKVLTMSVVDYY